MGDEVVRLTEPGSGTQFDTNEEFDLRAEFQWPPGFIQGSGVWQARQQGPWFNLGPDTMIKGLTQNPFPVNGQQGQASGEAKTTNFKGKFDLRIQILNDQMQEYAVSNVVDVTVGMGEVSLGSKEHAKPGSP